MKRMILLMAFAIITVAAYSQSPFYTGVVVGAKNVANKKPITKITGTGNKITLFSGSTPLSIVNPDSVSYEDMPREDLLYNAQLMGSDLKAIWVVPGMPTNYTDLTDSTLIITAVRLTKSDNITGVHLQMGNVTGNFVPSSTGFNGVSLCYSNGTSLIKVAQSANTKDNWTQSAYYGKDIPFTAPYFASAGIWYIVIQYNSNSATVIPKGMTLPTINAGYAGSFHTGGIATPLIFCATKANVSTLQTSILISTLTGSNIPFAVSLY